jgi:hypothetical protein
MSVPGADESIVGVISFVVAVTLVPFKTVELVPVPMVITLEVADPVPILMADWNVRAPVPMFKLPDVCVDPRFISPV